MRKTYLILARIIAIEVVVQAMAIAFAFAGVFKWIDDGATLDSSVVDSWDQNPPTFQGAIGHFIHVMNGQFLIPLIALILLIVSFFAKVPRGVLFATVLVVAIAIQIVLGLTSHSAPWLAGIHGLNAFIIFGAALEAAKAAKAPDPSSAAPATAAA